MENPTRSVCVTNQIMSPGRSKNMSAYRGELTGLYAATFLVYLLCDHFDIKQGSVTIGCDGISALHQAFSTYTPPSVDCPSFNLIMAIHRIRQRTPISWNPLHVAGHQDDHARFEDLDRISQLNVEADSLAKSFISTARLHPRFYDLKEEPWSIYYDGCKLLTFPKEIYNIIHFAEAFQYWGAREKIDPALLIFVQWGVITAAMKGMERSNCLYLSKHTMGMCGVGKWMKRWKERETADCPRCVAFEAAPHVLLCPGQSTLALWNKVLTSLSNWMTSVQTAPCIMEAILIGLNNWRFGYTTPLICVALAQQFDIGWNLFLKGWLSIEWETAQQSHYSSLHSLRTGQKRITHLIRHCWKIAWDLWEHRNDTLHGQENIVSSQQDLCLRLNITRSYGRISQFQLSNCDQYLTQNSLIDLLKKSRTYKEGWLRSAKTVVKAMKGSIRNSLRQNRHLRMVMRNWLQHHA
jgi:hypothetical protein